MHLSTVELDFPAVTKDGEIIGYGGNQEWFSREWQRRAGCGSVTGANLAAYYAARSGHLAPLYPGRPGDFSHLTYLTCMEEMYRYMTPGIHGYPFAGRFARDFALYCRERGRHARPVGCGKMASADDGFSFVKESIDQGDPLALLILHHRAPELKDDNWHWVTVSGYAEGAAGRQVLLSDCGERGLVGADTLFEVHPKNVIRMLRFSIS